MHILTGTMLLTALVCAADAADPDFVSWVREQGGRVQTGAKGEVTEVRVPYAWLTDSDVELVAAMHDVRKIDLSLSLITDAGMERLKELQNVTDLNLFAVEHITDTALAYIREWKKLERLNLRGTDITDTTLEYLATLPSIRSLDISYTQVTNNGLESLGALTHLEELTLGGNKVTGAGLRVLRLLPSLRTLSLSGAQKRNSGTWKVAVTDLDLGAIAALKALRSLDLAGLRITDTGIARLRPLASLSQLDLSRTEVSSKGLQTLQLNRMEHLSLHGAKRIDDSVAEVLIGAGELVVLDLSDTSLTDSGLARLSSLKKLGQLFLRGTNVTADGLAAFRSAHPACKVSWE